MIFINERNYWGHSAVVVVWSNKKNSRSWKWREETDLWMGQWEPDITYLYLYHNYKSTIHNSKLKHSQHLCLWYLLKFYIKIINYWKKLQ